MCTLKCGTLLDTLKYEKNAPVIFEGNRLRISFMLGEKYNENVKEPRDSCPPYQSKHLSLITCIKNYYIACYILL